MVLAMATEHSGEDKAARLRVGVIAGSTRPGRQSRTVAGWVCADPIPSLDLRLVDLADSGLPLLSQPDQPRNRPVPAACHAIVVPADRDVRRVRPGHAGVQPFDERGLEERARSPLPGMARQARRVRGYGLDGGTRAVEHLRAIAAELGMATVGPQVAISLRADYAGGRLEPRSFQPEARTADARPARSLGNGAAGSSAAHHMPREKPPRARRSLSKGSGHQRGRTARRRTPRRHRPRLCRCLRPAVRIRRPVGQSIPQAPCLDTRRSTPHTTRSWPQASPLHPGTRSCSS